MHWLYLELLIRQDTSLRLGRMNRSISLAKISTLDIFRFVLWMHQLHTDSVSLFFNVIQKYGLDETATELKVLSSAILHLIINLSMTAHSVCIWFRWATLIQMDGCEGALTSTSFIWQKSKHCWGFHIFLLDSSTVVWTSEYCLRSEWGLFQGCS